MGIIAFRGLSDRNHRLPGPAPELRIRQDVSGRSCFFLSDQMTKPMSWTQSHLVSGQSAYDGVCETGSGFGVSSGEEDSALMHHTRGNIMSIGSRAGTPRRSERMRAVTHTPCVLSFGTSPRPLTSRPTAFILDKCEADAGEPTGRPGAHIIDRLARRRAARGLLAAFFCAGVAGVGSAAAQSCLVDSNGDGHPLFGGMSTRGGSTFPVSSIASGDLNGDGFPDSVMTHESFAPGAGVISVLLNDGDGMMGQDLSVTLGEFAAPRSVQLGDLDGDTDLDLAYVDEEANQVVLYRNDGHGQFTFMDSKLVGTQPCSVVIANLDGVVGNDLAVLARVSDNVTVWKNNGSGLFTPGGTYSAGNVPEHVPNACPGQRTFRTGPRMTAADVDGVNSIDLIVPQEDGFGIMHNSGTGSFPTLQPEVLPVTGIAWSSSAADLNGDGRPDLAIALNDRLCGATLIVSLNEAGGSWNHTSYDVSFYEQYDPGYAYELINVAIGDVAGNEAPDIVVGNSYRLVNLMFVNDGTGHFGPAPPEYRWIAMGSGNVMGPILLDDFDRNGKLDLAMGRRDGGVGLLRVILHDGAEKPHIFRQHQRVPDRLEFAVSFGIDPWWSPVDVTVADVNGDSHRDLVSFDQGEEGVETHVNVVLNPGAGDFDSATTLTYYLPHAVSEPDTYGSLAVGVRAGDLNADGSMDLVIGEPGHLLGNGIVTEGSSLWVILNDNEGGFADPIRYDTTDGDSFGTTDVQLGDMDDDQDLDAVIVNSSMSYDGPQPVTPTRLRVYKNDSGTFTPGPWFDMGFTRTVNRGQVRLADLDHDGDLDAVANTGGSTGIWVWHNDGTGALTPVQTIAPFQVSETHTLVDLTDDGYQDLVVNWNRLLDPSAPDFAVFVYDPQTQQFSTRVDFSAGGQGAYGFVGADMNNDGLEDLIGVTVGGEATVWINHGFPVLDAGRYVSETPVGRMAVGDLDNDGDLEIVATCLFYPNLAVLNNIRCTTVLPGDLDGSGCVDLADLAIMLSSFGCAQDCGSADIDGGGVGLSDLSLLLSNFGECS